MVRINLEFLKKCPQFTNPLREREIDMRNQKVQRIENFGILQDGFDTIDLSDNELRIIGNIPAMKRLQTLIAHNNLVDKIDPGLGAMLPNLHTLVLHRNRISELSDIDALAEFKNLKRLSLVENPVTRKTTYRLYVIFKLPQLKVLDYQRVKDKEREESAGLYSGGEADVAATSSRNNTDEVVPTKEELATMIKEAADDETLEKALALQQKYYPENE
eukprot:PhF_6_TR35525/c0_g1_i1/m.51783/K11092/SNRPA1; U2 small nuclear ribonucleoprotein A'